MKVILLHIFVLNVFLLKGYINIQYDCDFIRFELRTQNLHHGMCSEGVAHHCNKYLHYTFKALFLLVIMEEHVIEALGKSRIVIQNGEVISVEDPVIDYCPLFDKYRGIKKLTKESIKDNIEFRIKDFGMCTENRRFPSEDFLSIGASEIISTLIKKEILEAAVIVSDGCGTVIVKDPDVVEGLAGRISGIIKTVPIKGIISFVGDSNVLNPENADINQIEGLKKAISKGYQNIAITISNAKDIPEIRKIEKDNLCNVFVFGVHTTGISKEDAYIFMELGDVITACMSKELIEIGDNKGIYKTKTKIPIYAPSEKGKKAIELRLKEIEKKK